MIAVITSTSIINKPLDWDKDYLVNTDVRISQTQATIASLKKIGINDIYLFDNSGLEHREYLSTMYKDVKLFVQDQYSFKNKGLSEIHLLLNNLSSLPSDTQICKISGRYLISNAEGFWENANELNSHDFVALKENKGIKTRMYLVKSKLVWEDLLISMLNRCYHRQYAITGIRSLVAYWKRRINYSYNSETPFLVIEGAFYEIVKLSKAKIKYVDKIHLKGNLATDPKTTIEE